MKKFIKTSLCTFSLGITLLAFCQAKRIYDNQVEDSILRRVQKRFPTQLIQGSWIQRQSKKYVGEVTVVETGHNVRHSFTATRNGQIISIN